MALLIRKGTIVDGTGAPPRQADLAVVGDAIAEIGELSGAADETIDASGLILSPGFIDLHSHTDYLLLANPLAESKLLQGVTCEVGGNCGSSAAPLNPEQTRRAAEALAPFQIEVDWQETDQFLARLEKAGIGPNFATLVGHGNLRSRIVGEGAGKATPEETRKMKEEAQSALQQGAFGLSAGLIYPPGCYADLEELAAVAGAARGRGFFALHIRDEGAGLLEAVEEALEICRRSGTPLQISHHKVTGKKNWGLVGESVEMIEKARRQGLEVSADIYPYTATNTSLSAVLPDWTKDGGREALLARLRDVVALKRIEKEWGPRALEAEQWEEYVVSLTFDMENKSAEGSKLSEICRAKKRRPLEVIASLLLADAGRTEIIRFAIAEEDIETVLRQPWVMIGSDAAAKDFRSNWGRPHPRAFGAFARFLAEYARERAIFSLPEAIRKMTSLPAWRLGLQDRGRIAPGCKADLVVFDFGAIADRATYAQPLRAPQGISLVMVNGVIAVREGELTGARPGAALRRS